MLNADQTAIEMIRMVKHAKRRGLSEDDALGYVNNNPGADWMPMPAGHDADIALREFYRSCKR